jgi:molybdopterin/thiamine biosynthesis adenylyltransferase
MANETVAVVGAGNVGLSAIMTLALVGRSLGVPWELFVVDFDRVSEKDGRKGYHPSLAGRFKADAAREMVRRAYGERAADPIRPVIAAAQSVPGLIRRAEAVFNGTDSTLDAAFVSEEARNTWELRLSTGIRGTTALHTVEVLPPGFTLCDVSYDAGAWADAGRHECRFGIPINSHAGVPQPFGAVTGALAVHLLLALKGGPGPASNRLVRIQGGEIWQCTGSEERKPALCSSREVPLSYEADLSRLYLEAGLRLGLGVDDLRLEFPVPIVVRHCRHSGHGGYRGFERQPVSGACPVCGEKTICSAAPRNLSLEEAGDLAHRSLRELNTPAGMRFSAWARDGGTADFHLPFRMEDVPALPQGM